ncbi:hypothetical protein M0R45_027015 [Rubus argutus]|uniref:Uncharacterized protein n=1 Tax=Rubus argutus TaxID=59490 RepID=A0AAW1WZM9_RUBAR
MCSTSNFMANKHARKGASPSWLWLSILIGRYLLLKEVLGNIGNGKSVDIWSDNWIPSLPPTSLNPTPIQPPLSVSSRIGWSSNSGNLTHFLPRISPDQTSMIDQGDSSSEPQHS